MSMVTLRIDNELISDLSIVDAPSDAHVALMGPGAVAHDAPKWEIVLGGWANTKSVIRSVNQGRALAEHHSELPLVHSASRADCSATGRARHASCPNQRSAGDSSRADSIWSQAGHDVATPKRRQH